MKKVKGLALPHSDRPIVVTFTYNGDTEKLLSSMDSFSVSRYEIAIPIKYLEKVSDHKFIIHISETCRIPIDVSHYHKALKKGSVTMKILFHENDMADRG